jgi:hypothetical protein
MLGESTEGMATCEHGVKIVYVGGYNDPTHGTWAVNPLALKLKAADIKVLNPELPGGGVTPDEVDYPAPTGGVNVPGLEFVTDKGAESLTEHLDKEPKDACLVLVGYSTGVIAVEKALDDLSDAVANRIRAVVLFGDPENVTPVLHGSSEAFAGRTIERCNPGDLLCSDVQEPLPRQQLLEQLDACGRNEHGGLVGTVKCLVTPHLPQGYKESGAAESAAAEATCLVTGCRSTYTVVSGDTLWGLAERTYGDGTQWRRIYDANRSVIEQAARDHGYLSSDNGNLIFPETALIIPSSG